MLHGGGTCVRWLCLGVCRSSDGKAEAARFHATRLLEAPRCPCSLPPPVTAHLGRRRVAPPWRRRQVAGVSAGNTRGNAEHLDCILLAKEGCAVVVERLEHEVHLSQGVRGSGDQGHEQGAEADRRKQGLQRHAGGLVRTHARRWLARPWHRAQERTLGAVAVELKLALKPQSLPDHAVVRVYGCCTEWRLVVHVPCTQAALAASGSALPPPAPHYCRPHTARAPTPWYAPPASVHRK